MLERLSSEQRARVASLIQKHSQQMLELIAEKLTLLEVIPTSLEAVNM